MRAEGKTLRRRRISLRLKKAKGKRQNWLASPALFLLLIVWGCGYQFAGKGEGFPKDVHSVFVEPFVNRTREVGLEREVTTALKSELRQKGQLRVVDRLEDADAVLSGEIGRAHV